jgi:hypothetical protein
MIKRTNSDKKSEGTTEQPTEVSGGFGLTCLVTSNESNASRAEYTCTYLDKDGNKFIDRLGLVVNTQLTMGSRSIELTTGRKDEDHSFRFTIPRLSAAGISITSTFVNPQDGRKTLLETATELEKVPSWTDVTLNAENKSSTCKDHPDNCTMTFSNKNDPAIWFTKKTQKGLTYQNALNFCEFMKHNFEPNNITAASRWRLAGLEELKKLFALQKQFRVNDRFIEVDQTTYWSEKPDEGTSTGTKVVVAETLQETTVQGTENHAAICVLDRVDGNGKPFHWSDITTSAAGEVSDCLKTPERCTKRDESSKLWWSATQSPAAGMTWSEAKSHCSGLSYNGRTGWRLPTRDELRYAAGRDILFFAEENWIPDANLRKNIWTSDYSIKDVDAFFALLAMQCPVVINDPDDPRYCPVQWEAGASWVQPVSTKNAVVCVRPDKTTWEDMTANGSCEDNYENCVLKLIATNTLYSGVLTGATSSTFKTWEDAKTLCQSYNPTGIGGEGTWTLPSKQQMLDAYSNKLKEFPGWRLSSMETAFWSNEADAGDPNMVRNMWFSNGSTGLILPTNQNQVFCVKPAQ